MAHCPYCGTKTNEDESFCVHCGKFLPTDLKERSQGYQSKGFNRWWILPISVFILSIIALGSMYALFEEKTTQAKEKFNQGEALALKGNYDEAQDYFNDALDLSYQFPAAIQNKQFLKVATLVKRDLNEAKSMNEEENFQKALEFIDKAEKRLKNYNGDAVEQLVNDITNARNQTKLSHLQFLMKKQPSIDEQKTLLWRAEAIQHEEAKAIANQIRKRIVSHAFSTANEELKQKQYTKARSIVEEGLRYAPDSEKLQSMKITIEKEKAAFEEAQKDRIEQAMEAAEKEREINKKDAVEIVSVETKLDEYGDLVVKGKIKSVATVPISSVSIKYKLYNKDGEMVLENDVYTYPDTLYPDEIGKFEFTHYDVNEKLEIKKEEIKPTWFLD
ncbi:FxLYD domain-containing protein [Pontibacillus marinus]|uniref:Uncharacterized protein n=1 Tax=Pontibacillus marinus BH030004 = DSM 16465 TaxID=1385511 RepID=A0A0A5FXJ2_9BACI|nr:FxLYD domain-containing protein [Pontibacillus marinus]KGX84519.1 hypothetical protein N783_17275 [Pontibacillus marinus BH030004 = DSM 16465]